MTTQTLDKALEFWEWLEHVHPACLTIADILALKPGDRLHVLPMHRNLCDHVYPQFEPARPAQPAPLFFAGRDGAVYVHEEGLRGRIEWHWDTERKYVDKPFEFEIEYQPDHWYPLTDGELPPNDPLSDTDLPGARVDGWNSVPETTPPSGESELPWSIAGRHWTSFPENTRVGWRGPMILWSKLDDQPPVFTRIDMKALAWFATSAFIREALEQVGIKDDRRRLRCTNGQWFLTVVELTEDERQLLEKRLTNIEIGCEPKYGTDDKRPTAW